MVKLSLFASRGREAGVQARALETARLYEYHGKVMVCSVAGIAETESLTIVGADTNDQELGEAVRQHLAEYRAADTRDMRSMKATDWAAFRASGARSVKSFEADLWHVDLTNLGTAFRAEARPRLSLNPEIAVCCGANCALADQVGSAVRKTIAAAKVLREQGVV